LRLLEEELELLEEELELAASAMVYDIRAKKNIVTVMVIKKFFMFLPPRLIILIFSILTLRHT